MTSIGRKPLELDMVLVSEGLTKSGPGCFPGPELSRLQGFPKYTASSLICSFPNKFFLGCFSRLVLGIYHCQWGQAASPKDAWGHLPGTGQHPPQLPVHTLRQDKSRSHQCAHRIHWQQVPARLKLLVQTSHPGLPRCGQSHPALRHVLHNGKQERGSLPASVSSTSHAKRDGSSCSTLETHPAAQPQRQHPQSTAPVPATD